MLGHGNASIPTTRLLPIELSEGIRAQDSCRYQRCLNTLERTLSRSCSFRELIAKTLAGLNRLASKPRSLCSQVQGLPSKFLRKVLLAASPFPHGAMVIGVIQTPFSTCVHFPLISQIVCSLPHTRVRRYGGMLAHMIYGHIRDPRRWEQHGIKHTTAS